MTSASGFVVLVEKENISRDPGLDVDVSMNARDEMNAKSQVPAGSSKPKRC